jgi:hypothetical protein
VEGSGKFPQFLEGTWKGDKLGWELEFGPGGGGISSAVIPLGQVRVRPNQTSRIEGARGEPGIFEAGDFVVNYEPRNRGIFISIAIEHIYEEIGGGILEGGCEYFIEGSILEDEKTMEATVFTALDLDAYMPDANAAEGEPALKQVGDFRTEPEEDKQRVNFTKVADIEASGPE